MIISYFLFAANYILDITGIVKLKKILGVSSPSKNILDILDFCIAFFTLKCLNKAGLLMSSIENFLILVKS